ncbi:hypothetical protein SAMN05444358_101242 [Ruegeria halocynthiae]|uniref:Uncharacterized protein n=1 Tax=Ruegeria halocynthiae TaxID=985054 RepID=A0A1H2RT12_9RHOB|nr:hypothetical protein [Ruegeria halocynthiae]SDW21769.1 hypothetical protein SAMN05444358_101242 [Ruegeria halocynthiae]
MSLNSSGNQMYQGVIILGAVTMMFSADTMAQSTMPNACPVDGCEVRIVSIAKDGDELTLMFEANFTPDVSKNHFHSWWGDTYSVEQVGRNAQSEFNVVQGRWHRHDDFPSYVTKEAASTAARDGGTTMCVTAADRDHNILDATKYHCVDVQEHL